MSRMVPTLPALIALTGVALLTACTDREAPDDETNPARAEEPSRIASAEEIISGAQVSKLDPATLHDAEIRKALGDAARCEFRYTSSRRPALAASMTAEGMPSGGVVKLNGRLLLLKAGGDASRKDANASTLILTAAPITLTVTPDSTDGPPTEKREANAVFEVGDELKVGYRGYLSCVPGTSTVSSKE
jgi:hypothetical protein